MVKGKPGQTGDALERELYILRKLVERAKTAQMPAEFAPDFFICTLSNRTIVYKVWNGGIHVRGILWADANCSPRQQSVPGLQSVPRLVKLCRLPRFD